MTTILCSVVKFGYDKYLIVPFLVRFDGISGSFGLAMGILARLYKPWLHQTGLMCEGLDGVN